MKPYPPNFSLPSEDPRGGAPGFAVVDFETTGFTKHDRVLEIGVVTMDADFHVEGRWRTLVQPDRGFDNSHIHKIVPSDLVDAPTFEQVARRFAEVINGRVIVGHNVSFERRFLEQEFARLDYTLPSGPWAVDTRAMAHRAFPGESVTLENLVHRLGLKNVSAHTALADADVTAQLFKKFVSQFPAELADKEPFFFDEAAVAQLPFSEVPLVERNDGLFGAEDTGTDGGADGEAGSETGGEEDGDTVANAPVESEESLWLKKLTDEVPALGDQVSDQYISFLAQAMVDGRLDVRELSKLHAIAAERGLGADDIVVLHEHYLQQLIVQAWSDGSVSEQERTWLIRIAEELNIERDRVDSLIFASGELRLLPGDRVTFTGAMATPREVWEAKARAAGLDVGGVIKNSSVLVAADVNTASNKAKKARKWGIPIVDEATFARAFAVLVEEQRNTEEWWHDGLGQNTEDSSHIELTSESDSLTEEPESILGRQDFAEIFPWLESTNLEGMGDTISDIAKAWMKDFRTTELSGLSPYMNFVVFPETSEWQRVLQRLGLTEKAVPETSVRDLFDVKGYGRVRVQKLVADAVMHAFDEFEASGTVEANEEAPDNGFDAADEQADEGTEGPLDRAAANMKDAVEKASEGVKVVLEKVFDGSDGGVVGNVFDRVANAVDAYSDLGDRESVVWDDSSEPDSTALLDWLALSGESAWLIPEDADYMPAPVRNQISMLHDRIDGILIGAEREIQAIGDQDERFISILNNRLVGGASLDEVGQQYGITRERIRQLEAKLRTELSDAGPYCEQVRAALVHRYAPLAKIERIKEELPRLFEIPSGMSATLFDLVQKTGTVDAEVPTAGWEIDNGWFVATDFGALFDAVFDRAVDNYGVATLTDVTDKLGTSEDNATAWICERTPYRIFEGKVFTRVSSVSDRAIALLSHRGTPMHIDEIAEIMADRNARAIDGQLSQDPRTKRSAAGTWALSEWGLEEWTNIADYIGRRIDQATEQEQDGVPLADLIDGAVAFGVAESSVRTYAASSDFTVEDGIVRRRRDEEYKPVEATPEESKGLYWKDDHWALLLTITHDHVRGSGVQIPSGIAGMYELGFGDEKILPSRLGDQRISVGRTTTNMSTISRFVKDMELAEGDRAWVHFGESFDITRAPAINADADGLAAIVNIFGLDEHFADNENLETDGVLAAINEALGLPADAARRKAVSRLRHRREDALAERIREL